MTCVEFPTNIDGSCMEQAFIESQILQAWRVRLCRQIFRVQLFWGNERMREKDAEYVQKRHILHMYMSLPRN